jgi:hypothetical protein
MSNRTSIQILSDGAIDAVQRKDSSGADALFLEYLGAMKGTGRHAELVAKDLEGLEVGVRKTLASRANNGAWWAELDPETSAQVTTFFGLLQQSAQRIDELEKPETDTKKISAQIDRDLATLAPLMERIGEVVQLLGQMGMGYFKYDEAKLGENLGEFRSLRRRAAEILVPMEKQAEQMSPEQKTSFETSRNHLLAYIREVRTGMMLNG